MTTLTAVLAVVVVYRLTMLVVADEITEPIRDRIIDRFKPQRLHAPAESDWRVGYATCTCGQAWRSGVDDEPVSAISARNDHVNSLAHETTQPPKWLMLLECPWCASVWIGMPVAWSAWCFGGRAWWAVPAVGLAGSAVAGVVATFAKP